LILIGHGAVREILWLWFAACKNNIWHKGNHEVRFTRYEVRFSGQRSVGCFGQNLPKTL
jgi:hypothetical protein